MTTLLIATTNPGKVGEIAAFLADLDCRVIGLKDLPQPLPDVEETGETFLENALLKGDYYHSVTGLLTIAEDSGLEVDALGGRPGVYSARYGGDHPGADKQIARLLEELKDVPMDKRTARFICSLVLVGEDLRESFEGRCDGLIAFEPRGSGGFGYDPVFIDQETGLTFAELTGERKTLRSHRGRALRQAREFLRAQEF